MKKRIFVYSLLLVASSVLAQAQTFKFDFSSDKKVQATVMIFSQLGTVKVINRSFFR